jgi:hypothetical protein
VDKQLLALQLISGSDGNKLQINVGHTCDMQVCRVDYQCLNLFFLSLKQVEVIHYPQFSQEVN